MPFAWPLPLERKFFGLRLDLANTLLLKAQKSHFTMFISIIIYLINTLSCHCQNLNTVISLHQVIADKRSQSWLQRQFSKQMSRSDGYSAGEDELAAAVAAAAFAVNNLEGSASPKRSPTSTGPERTLTKAKSKRQNASTPLENGTASGAILRTD